MGAFLTGLAIAAVTWWFAPVISFLLNKLLSYLYDASQEFRQMRSGTVQRLKFTLGEVVEQRMLLIKLSKKKSDMTKLSDLDTLLKKLEDALYEAEDILDRFDYHRIEKEVGKAESSTWLLWCWQRLCDSTRETSAPLLQRTKQLLRWLRRCVPGSRELPVVSPPPSLVQRISLCCRSFGSNNCCSCIFNLLTKAIEGARYYRDWSFIELSFTCYQEGVVMESNCTIFGPLYILLKENMKKVEQLTDEAQEIITFKKKVQETIGQENQPRRNESGMSTAKVTTGDRQKTTAYPVGKVTGRDNVCQHIRTMLHASKFDVVGIYGIAGSGKTTLAQYVCNAVKEEEEEKEREEKECHFHLFMWIDVTQKFSVHGIFSEMLEAVSGQKAEYNSLGVLQTKLKNELNGKRFLLVLDDIWCNMDADEQNLQRLIFPLQFGMKGSKILATSRNKGAFAALGPEVTYTSIPIPDLNDEDFYEMFMHYAFGSSGLVDPESEKLEEIGAEIAKKLKRLPLAARTVGGQLRRKQDVRFWRSVQARDLLNETTGALWWSYQQFDEQVRRCFAYCSIFPRRHHFKRDKLVQLWMAEDFIERSAEELDAVGQDYFDQLLSASFLQLGERRVEHGCEVDYFTVHDLLRDLAEEAARGACFRIEEGITEEVPPDVRHIFVGSCDMKVLTEKILELQNLRTLIIDCYIKFYSTDKEVFERMFRRLKKLRVLVLRFATDDDYIFSLPACIGLLKHLRYFVFGVRGKAKLILPNSITELYHIQLLDVYGCDDVVISGSNNISHLINLRCVSNWVDFPNVGRLKWLQKLVHFGVMKKHGYEVRQMKDLNKLEGTLHISGLENVQSKEESIEASLADKARLTELVLNWDDTSCRPEVEAEVLEGLCPSKYLERLEIRDYHGSTYPNWMVGKHNGGPKHLCNLWLSGCSRLEPAPELFEVFVHLRSFRLWFSNWHALPDNMEQLTSLLFLDINRCPNIRSLPVLPSSLEDFWLLSCNEELMGSCQTTGHLNWQKIQHIPNKRIRRFVRWI